jgi:hypothetical protein
LCVGKQYMRGFNSKTFQHKDTQIQRRLQALPLLPVPPSLFSPSALRMRGEAARSRCASWRRAGCARPLSRCRLCAAQRLPSSTSPTLLWRDHPLPLQPYGHTALSRG